MNNNQIYSIIELISKNLKFENMLDIHIFIKNVKFFIQ